VAEDVCEPGVNGSKVSVLGVVIIGVIASIVEPAIYTLGGTVAGATLALVLVAYDDDSDEETRLQSTVYAGALAVALMAHNVYGWLVSKFLKERVVFSTRLLIFRPLHVALKPGVAAALLGSPPRKASLPVGHPLVTVGNVGQLPELPPSFGIGNVLERSLEGLARPSG
jgi:hypothetical protein